MHVLLKWEKAKFIYVDLTKIIFIKSDGDHCEIHFQSNCIKVRCKVSFLEKKLKPFCFVRINRMHLINMSAVATIEDRMIFIKKLNNEMIGIPVGPKYYKSYLKDFIVFP